jgi:hypothetical protein
VVAYSAAATAPAIASACPEAKDEPAAPAARHWAWADLMRRAFDIDVLPCPRCDGRLRLITTVEDPGAIRAILAALAESRELTGRAPPFAAAQTPTRRRSAPERHPHAAVTVVCPLASLGRDIPLDRWSVS